MNTTIHILSEREEVMARSETCRSGRGGGGEPRSSAKKYGKNTRKKSEDSITALCDLARRTAVLQMPTGHQLPVGNILNSLWISGE